MRIFVNGVLLLILFAWPCSAQVLTVAEARLDSNGDGIPDRLGEIVTIQAIATCEGTLFSESGLSFYVQDETAGINVYAYESASPGTIDAGDEWMITGEIMQYNGLVEISPEAPADFQYRGHPGVPAPLQMVRNQGVSESIEGLLLALGNISQNQWVSVATTPSSAGGGYNFDVWNGLTAVAVRVDGNTGISVAGIEVGTRLFMIGLGGQYDSEPPYTSGYQILPRYQSDLEIWSPSIPDYFHLDVSGNPFAPSVDEFSTIEYGGTAGSRFTLTVYDRTGRAVTHLVEAGTTGDMFLWDGRDDSGEVLPMGQYLLFLECVDTDGTRLTTTETVVVATPLN
jgi:hypothetical protein